MSGQLNLALPSGGSVTVAAPDSASDTTVTLPAGNNTLGIQGPAFRASYTTTTTLSNSTWTKITLDNETFDTNNNFASSRFTPTVAGYYQINAGIETTNTGYPTLLSIYKNGSAYASAAGAYQTSNIDSTGSVSDLVYLNGTTDYVEMYAIQLSGSSQNVVGSTVTHLSGFLARAA